MFEAGVNILSLMQEHTTRPSFNDITNTPQRACVRSLSSITRSISRPNSESCGVLGGGACDKRAVLGEIRSLSRCGLRKYGARRNASMDTEKIPGSLVGRFSLDSLIVLLHKQPAWQPLASAPAASCRHRYSDTGR